MEIELYNSLELEGRRLLSNRQIQAFSPVTFSDGGYPTRCSSDQELWKFHDTMQEGRFSLWLHRDFPGGLEEKLYKLWTLALESINCFGKSLASPRKLNAGQNSLVLSLGNFSRLKTIFDSLNVRISPFELGPGCGYLQLLFGIDGVKTRSVDITQAYFIYQSRLFSFCEAEFDRNRYQFQRPQQIFWWDIARDPTKILRDTNVLVANHMLNEMHPHSLRFILSKLADAWHGDSNSRFVYAEMLGGGKYGDEAEINGVFNSFGFSGLKLSNRFYFWTLGGVDWLRSVLTETQTPKKASNLVPLEQVKTELDALNSEQHPDEIFYNEIKLKH